MSKYPTGVESHGGTLCLWFIYQGVRVRESLGAPDTQRTEKWLESCVSLFATQSKQEPSITQCNFHSHQTCENSGLFVQE